MQELLLSQALPLPLEEPRPEGQAWRRAPLDPLGSWESFVVCSPDAEEQAYYQVRLSGAEL